MRRRLAATVAALTLIAGLTACGGSADRATLTPAHAVSPSPPPGSPVDRSFTDPGSGLGPTLADYRGDWVARPGGLPCLDRTSTLDIDLDDDWAMVFDRGSGQVSNFRMDGVIDGLWAGHVFYGDARLCLRTGVQMELDCMTGRLVFYPEGGQPDPSGWNVLYRASGQPIPKGSACRH